MAVEVDGLDVATLRSEIQKTYTNVSENPDSGFIFPTGRAWAEELEYPKDLLDRIPEAACESFAGVANPFSFGALTEGEHSLDLGCGAGMDLLVAAQMVGPSGTATGIDMTPAMVDKARGAAEEMGATNVTVVEGDVEALPFDDASFDVVTSNGVIDLLPDKTVVFSEIFRVLKPGGRMQIADVTIQRPVSEEGKRDIDLWTG
jgi:SAM-dependent methyltransferase